MRIRNTEKYDRKKNYCFQEFLFIYKFFKQLKSIFSNIITNCWNADIFHGLDPPVYNDVEGTPAGNGIC